jgi:uncharacterized membrane protein
VRLGYGEKIAGVSAILLFVFMFLDWFGTQNSGGLVLFSVGRSAWEALDYIPIVLMIAIVGALAVVALRLSDTAYEPPVPANAVVAVLGTVSALLILFRIVDPPNFGSLRDPLGTVPIEGTAELPIFLALVAALGIALGGCLAMRGDGERDGSVR